MKKKVWIFNHYATNSYYNKGGRHYWFAKNLIEKSYEPVIFCANTRHNSSDIINIKNSNFKVALKEGIPFVFIKTRKYSRNGLERIGNMITFYKNLYSVSKSYAKKYGKPDIIIASSVHPLTLVAGIKIAKKFGVPCICEVRDLWPESLVAYNLIKRNSPITKLLYKGEKWIYRKADSVIMTWEGGKDYIVDQGWQKHVDLNKIVHISNGVVISDFDKNSEEFIIKDQDLESKNYKKIIYAGSIRKVNNIGLLLDAAKVLKKKGLSDVKFLIYGSGNELESLKQRCLSENICNVEFKGRVDKKYVPYILKNADVNILHNSSTILDKYGQSQNKFFEYLAAGRCIVQTYSIGYSICERYNCGISVSKQNAEEIANAIETAIEDEDRNQLMAQNARNAAMDYDFIRLTNKLINTIEKL